MMGCRHVKRLQSNACKAYILKIRSYTTKLALCFHNNYDGSDGMRKMTIAITIINLESGRRWWQTTGSYSDPYFL